MTDVELDVADSFERVFPVPTVVADWDDVVDRAGARSRPRTQPPPRWRVVAIAVAIVGGGALLVSPALGTQHPAKDVRPAWSPEGRRIAFVSRRDGQSEVYVMNADGSGKRNLTRDRANDDYPTWSPDGRRIAFLRATRSYRVRGLGVIRYDGYHLYVVNADGSELRRLTRNQTGTYTYHQLAWSPDGRTIHFGRYLVSADGSGARRLPYIPLTAVWSPDGRRIAFVRKVRTRQFGPDYGNREIYVMNADGSGQRRLTHNGAYDAQPAWSPDGRKIAFRSARNGNTEIYVTSRGTLRGTAVPPGRRTGGASPSSATARGVSKLTS